MENLPPATVFDLLSNERRLRMLSFLADRRRAELSAIATHVAAVETGVPRAEVTKADRKRVFISLYQTHVPRLAEHDVIRYDDASGVVELVGEGRLLAPFRTAAHERPFRRAAVLATLLAWVVVAGSLVSLSAITVVVGELVTVTALLTVVTAAYWRADTRPPRSINDVIGDP